MSPGLTDSLSEKSKELETSPFISETETDNAGTSVHTRFDSMKSAFSLSVQIYRACYTAQDRLMSWSSVKSTNGAIWRRIHILLVEFHLVISVANWRVSLIQRWRDRLDCLLLARVCGSVFVDRLRRLDSILLALADSIEFRKFKLDSVHADW